MSQQPFATSGAVNAIPITITPMIAAAFARGPTVMRVQNTGANKLLLEISFSWDGVNWDVAPAAGPDFDGPDGTGQPAGASFTGPIADKRPPWIRVRAQSASATTNAQVDLYEVDMSRPGVAARQKLIPVTT